MTQGMLYVTMQPRPGLSEAQFHEWYNNEHGPTRLRLPHIFTNGLRFRATDGQPPTYLATYDVSSMSHLETPTYTDLRANRSPREAETIGQVDVRRYFWDLLLERRSPSFVPPEQRTDRVDEADGTVLIAVEVKVKPDAPADAPHQIQKWYEQEHVDMLAKVPGWLRSRLYRTSALEKTDGTPSFLGFHYYARGTTLQNPEFKAATSTPWRDEVYDKYGTMGFRRVYGLSYVFGPAPRDLYHLARLPSSSKFESEDAKTVTVNDDGSSGDVGGGRGAVITSYVTVPGDGLEIPYRLEGNGAPGAPTIAFCNSLLTSLEMWDPFVALLKRYRPDYRILRYDTRGRHAIPSPPRPADLDMVAADLAALLEALRIPKLDVLVGVSMGGATALKFAIKYPGKLGKLVACDFNVASSAANTSAWKDRIGIAESTPGEDGSPGIRQLAGQTVSRWFHPDTMAGKGDVVKWMEDMVAANDVEGFRYGCQALWDYDMKTEMKGCKVPGLLVVGEGDGKGALVKAMDGFKGNLGEKGAELAVVPAAGHLPMCENPEGFWKAIEGFV
ncbi:Alpha/Beta hydrolase protein [Xylariomycetidae sp. FL2044]|nr:Alpha/Beta hydrolase protein [Xylariomycetidae sp. FL2044]